MGPDPPDVVGPEQLPDQGHATAHHEADVAEEEVEMGVFSSGISNNRSKF